MDVVSRGSQQAAWDRARDRLHFATDAALAPMNPASEVRVTVLPGDPEAKILAFDDDFWAWWVGSPEDRRSGIAPEWGSDSRPTQHAAALKGDQGGHGWRRYVAVLRSGGVDVALGQDAGGERNLRDEAVRMFALVTIVGRVLSPLAVWRAVTDRFSVVGPWEIALRLRDTQNALLAHLGTGWAEPNAMLDDPPVCDQPELMITRSLENVLSESDAEALAFDFGGEIEDAWGMKLRRFLARGGDHEREFDAARLRW